jgi:hypothetical protein
MGRRGLGKTNEPYDKKDTDQGQRVTKKEVKNFHTLRAAKENDHDRYQISDLLRGE